MSHCEQSITYEQNEACYNKTSSLSCVESLILFSVSVCLDQKEMIYQSESIHCAIFKVAMKYEYFLPYCDIATIEILGGDLFLSVTLKCGRCTQTCL